MPDVVDGGTGHLTQGLQQIRRRLRGDGISGGINVIGIEGVAEEREWQRGVGGSVRRRRISAESWLGAASERTCAASRVEVECCGVAWCGCVPADAALCAVAVGGIVRAPSRSRQTTQFPSSAILLFAFRGRGRPRHINTHHMNSCHMNIRRGLKVVRMVNWSGQRAAGRTRRRDRRFASVWQADRGRRERFCEDGRG